MAPSCAVNSCNRLDQFNLRMIGCKVVLRNEMISYSCFATLMRSFKSLKQAFYQHENNSTSSDCLMDACFCCAVLLKWLKRTVLKTVRSANPMPEFESLRPRQSFSRRAYIIPVSYHRLKGRIYCVFVAKLVRHSTFNRGIAEFKSRRIHQLCAYRLMPKTVSSKLTYLCWIRSGRAKAN